jgi:hypothetical protein
MTRTACTAPRRVSLLMSAALHAEVAAWAAGRGLSLSAAVRRLTATQLAQSQATLAAAAACEALAAGGEGGAAGAGESPTPPQPPAV